MKELAYLADDLDVVESATLKLEKQGIPHDAIRVLSEDDAGVDTHHLEPVPEWEKRDLIRRGFIGAGVGVVLAASVILLAYGLELYHSFTWAPFILLAIVVAGFCTWEGGLIGSFKLNRRFEGIKDKLKAGAHLMLVKVDTENEGSVNQLVQQHKGITSIRI